MCAATHLQLQVTPVYLEKANFELTASSFFVFFAKTN